MSNVADLQAIEQPWLTMVRRSATDAKNRVRVVTLCGPSGSGKTTLARALATDSPAYIETTDGNPYLQALLEGSEDFDAAANQSWFLERMRSFIAGADPSVTLVLDQDPSAIVLVYARMFVESGLLDVQSYSLLMQRLLMIEDDLQRWKIPRLVICLDAPPENLQARVARRLGGGKTPPREWFVAVRRRFQNLFPVFENSICISTGEGGPDKTLAELKALLPDLC